MAMIDCATKLNDAACKTLVKNGVTHVGRYLPTSDWKALSVAEVETVKNAGMQIISIYEQGATKASYFTKEQGIADAKKGEQLAKSLNQPEGTAIYFTVDYDAQTKDFAGILNYFQGLQDTLTAYKIGAYGKFDVIVLLQTKKLADYYWQTYAWSHGQRAKNLHLFQFQNDVKGYGVTFGIDMVNIENDACGSWGSTPTVKKDVTVKPKATPKVTTYQVVSGDTLSALAIKFNTTVKNLQTLNHLPNPDHLSIGQVLKVTGSVSKPPDQKKAKVITYTIKKGDDLTHIASAYHTSIDKIMKLNPTMDNPNFIVAGKKIKVPDNR